MFGLLPRNLDFFNLFEEAAENVVRAAELLGEMCSGGPSHYGEKAGAVKEREHAGDRFTHETLDRLDKTYITPFDREDIHRLITDIDDIVDHINAVANRLRIYQIREITPAFREHCEQLLVAARQMRTAVKGLRHLRRGANRRSDIEAAIIAVHDAENESDDIHHRSLADLFQCGFDAFEVIKWKEIYDLVEAAVDCCEDVANTIRGILLKNA